jgi:histidyl-tRNA synthetase
MIKAQTLKGFRDFLPTQMVIREKVVKTLKEVFEEFGFEQLQTPTLEYADVLMGKYGEEADKLLYTFDDRGGRKVGLNYDLTVPLARVLSQYSELPMPFKRYQIQPSYRAENPQKGRYRQFTQCDIDTIGSSSPLSDAEIIAVIYFALKRLGFNDFEIKLNSRNVSYGIMKNCGIAQDKWNTTLQTVDKLDKKSIEELDLELEEKEMGSKLFSSSINTEIAKVSKNWTDNQDTGDKYLNQVYKTVIQLGVNTNNIQFNPSTVRGLDYYTGPVFETFVKDANIGSVASGGRYDQLIEQLGGPQLPAVGTTLGLDRICDAMEETNQSQSNQLSTTRVLVSIFSPELKEKSVELSSRLRSNNINTELYLDENAKIEKQLKYADSKQIPFVAIIGPDEAKNNTVTLKNMQTREQKVLPLQDLPNELTQ